MSQQKVRILVLGDELGLGEPLQRALERAGHDVEYAMVPDEAFPILSQRGADYVFVDCMLQGGMNGVDFVVHVKENFPQVKAKFVLMSGVFTDKAFVRESMDRTEAIAFLEKRSGFDFNQATKLIVPLEAEKATPARKLLYQMFAKETVSAREKRKVIESLEEVSGFDLPFIYSLLVETESSGYLNIYDESGNVSGITFSKTGIVGVDVEDEKTFLGEMLIQSGFVLSEDVAEALKDRANRKLGMRLIKAGRLSPHALDIVLTEQMNIRLSRTIVANNIRINFAATEVEPKPLCIDSDRLETFLHDWIASKISVSWLKSLYVMLAGNSIQVLPTCLEDCPSLQTGLVKALPDLYPKLKAGTTLNRLLSEHGYSEAAVYKGIHFLLTKGLIIFGNKAAFRSEQEQLQSLRKVAADLEGKTPFEIVDLLGLENTQSEGLDALIGPEPRGAAATQWRELKRKIEDAVRHTTDTHSRVQFAQKNAAIAAEARLKASQMIEEARKALGLNQYAKAMAILTEVQKLNPEIEHLHTLLAWAKIGQMEPRSAPHLKEIEFELLQVPAEERYDAHYPFVLGLFHKVKGDVMGARKHIERAIALNSTLMAARRELSAIDAQLKKDADIFGEFKGLVGGLFGRK